MRNDRMLQDAQAALDAADKKSIAAMRACIVALGNGYPMPPDQLAILVAYETDSVRQKNLQSTAMGIPANATAPAWLRPVKPV